MLRSQIRSQRIRRFVAVVAVASLALSPRFSRADDFDAPLPSDSPVGVVMATICGASACIARLAPEIGIVWAVAAFSCGMAFLDASASSDDNVGP